MEKNNHKLNRLFLNSTNLCNLGCIFCWRASSDREYQDPECIGLSKEKHMNIIEDAMDLGCEHFTITGGGEPVMRREDFSMIIGKIKELEGEYNRNIKGDVTTNGTLLTEKIVRKMVDIGWDWIAFSLHSTRAKTNDYLMGKEGTFNKILEKIKMINNIKEKKSQKPKLSTHFVINKHNYDELLEFVEFANELDVKHVAFRTLVEHNAYVSGLAVGREEMREIKDNIEKIKERINSYGMGMDFQFDLEKFAEETSKSNDENRQEERKNEGFCILPFSEIVIQANGEVYPCCTFPKMDGKAIDNINNKSLKEIWTGGRFNELRKRVVGGKLPEMCENCNPDTVVYKQDKLKEIKSRTE